MNDISFFKYINMIYHLNQYSMNDKSLLLKHGI